MEKLFDIASKIDTPIALAALALIAFAKLVSIILKKSQNSKYNFFDKIVNFSFVIAILCIIFVFYAHSEKTKFEKESVQNGQTIQNEGNDANNTNIQGDNNKVDNSRNKTENHGPTNNVKVDVKADKSNVKVNAGSGNQN